MTARTPQTPRRAAPPQGSKNPGRVRPLSARPAARVIHPPPIQTPLQPAAALMPAAKFLTVSEDEAGQRLDNFLIRQLKGVPKTHVYRIIRSGEVRINKGRVQAETRVQAGDSVRLPPVRSSARADAKAQAMQQAGMEHDSSGGTEADAYAPAREFPILLEDDWLLAIAKPAGVAVHGGSGVRFGVIEQLRMARPEAEFLELVHRLDRDTSGILLIAKRRAALRLLQAQFRERETDKIYLALVQGQWPSQHRVIDKALYKYLLPDGERRVRVVPNEHPEGMRSITLVKLRQLLPPSALAPTTPLTLLEVTIKTGRTHQIRVHLASAGHPIAGDDKYGDFELNRALQKSGPAVPLKRLFLHAWRLTFQHPKTRKTVQLETPLPADLQNFIAYAPYPL